jgi:hypothetical protein
MSELNRQWRLARRPVGMVEESCFSLHETPVPEPGPGEIVVRNCYLSFEPAMRGWIEDAPSYLPPVAIGEVMRASAVGQVVASSNDDFPVGQCVSGLFGWQDYALIQPGGLTTPTPVPADVALTHVLSVLGMTSVTAYFGLLDLGDPQPGETVVVTGAAGATGSIAAQIARLKGCRVVGTAGGPEKTRWLREEAKLDAVIDYKREDVATRLGELCPGGINVAFDNVGGETLDAILVHIAQNARVVLCGMISQYNDEELQPQLRHVRNLVTRRGRMEGFIVLDYLARTAEAMTALQGWLASGELAFQEDIQQGMEQVPRTFLRLFRGENLGKQLCQIAEPPLGR